MIPAPLVILVALAYLVLLFGVAFHADRRAAQGRSLIGNAWVYTLSLAVYCTAWTYFGSVGRAAGSGVWFLPIYLGPTLGMILAWLVVRKMIRIARTHRITSIADFIGSRYGKSPALASLVTLITVVGIVPYIALQLKAISVGYTLLTQPPEAQAVAGLPWWRDTALYVALALAGFTVIFGARRLDTTVRHEGMVAAIAFESVVKLVAFLAVGVFVTWGLFNGPADIFDRALADPELARLLRPSNASPTGFDYGAWFGLTLLSMLSVVFLPRQFQVMVVENVDESHLRRAAWAFPAYMLLINLFVLPIALGGLLHFAGTPANPEGFLISLPLSQGHQALALVAFIGGMSAATGMVIVEAIAVSTMVSNDLIMPWLLRLKRFRLRDGGELTGVLLATRRAAIVGILLLGYLYFHLAGEAYALVSIGLISFAAVAQFAPAMLGGMYWKGGTRRGAMAGLVAGFSLWVYTLLLPSFSKSGWLPAEWMDTGPMGIGLLRPGALLGLSGWDSITHTLFWSLTANVAAYAVVSLWRAPSARETSQAMLFVDVFERTQAVGPAFWRGRAQVGELLELAGRFLGRSQATARFERYARQIGVAGIEQIPPDARLVQFVETELAGVIGSASARVMVASVVEEELLERDDVMRMVEETSQLRQYSHELEEKSRSLEQATAELREANEQLKSLDRLRDDFMSSVSHELRTPLTSIRALAELMQDDPQMDSQQRQQFLGIVVGETERLSRLVNQVLDLAKIESGQGEWHHTEVNLNHLLEQAVQGTHKLFEERGAQVHLHLPAEPPMLHTDSDRLTQVMINLLGNAAKFVPAGTGRVDVHLSTDRDGVTVSVQDNGPGVPADLRSTVFDKFRQAGDESMRRMGTGLGLPISRQIVEHFGGRMWLDSPPGQGACFHFHLPWTITPDQGAHSPASLETTDAREDTDRR